MNGYDARQTADIMRRGKFIINMKTRRLTKKEMWIFAIGQLGWSILGGLINAWLVTFYLPTQQDIERGAKFYLPTGLIIFGILTILGLIAFICRIFDAVTDPWIASLSDRSKNPKGRRIPFMKRAAIPFFHSCLHHSQGMKQEQDCLQ